MKSTQVSKRIVFVLSLLAVSTMPFVSTSKTIHAASMPNAYSACFEDENGNLKCSPRRIFQSSSPVITAVPVIAAVATTALNLQSDPGANYTVLQTLKKGQTFVVVGRSADNLWMQLNVNGIIGWSPCNCLNLVGDLNTVPMINYSPIMTPTPRPTPSAHGSIPPEDRVCGKVFGRCYPDLNK